MATLYPAPNPSAVYWRREKENGKYEYATIQSMVKDDNGNWKALFLIPGQAPYYINQNNNDLRNWEPVYALTDDNLLMVIEKIAQRVTEILTDKGVDASDIVPAAMNVAYSDNVEEAVEAAVEATADYDTEDEAMTDPEDPDYYVDSSYQKQKKKFVCGVCGKKYAYEKSLRKHLEKEHSLQPDEILKHVQ
tara:strand:+ start:337 stop:909 length:573 start_codon:yes stop_codon:yes gene_type:complete